MSKYIYRIEHKETGIGPYHQRQVNKEGFSANICVRVESKLGISFYNSIRNPDPRGDGLGMHIDSINGDSESRFGFASLIKLKRWFSEHKEVYKLFEKFEMVLARYEVKERFDSSYQSVAYIDKMASKTILPFSRLNLK